MRLRNLVFGAGVVLAMALFGSTALVVNDHNRAVAQNAPQTFDICKVREGKESILCGWLIVGMHRVDLLDTRIDQISEQQRLHCSKANDQYRYQCRAQSTTAREKSRAASYLCYLTSQPLSFTAA